MRIRSLRVSNLRAIRHFEVSDLPDFVVVAGANGSGKSCLFDAIRLLKSVYGGYQANEYHQWFGELGVNIQDPKELAKLFRDPSKQIEIHAEISFAPEEVEFVGSNAEALVPPVAWQQVTGQPVDHWSWNRVSVATQMRTYRPQVNAVATKLVNDVRADLSNDTQSLTLIVQPSGEMLTTESPLAEVAFQAYEPEHLGVIEYHSASRSYSRQQLGGITLDTRQFEEVRRQSRLYNSQQKYQNVKTQLATAYLQSLVRADANEPPLEAPGEDLDETMKELFRTFFPDKTYEGVRPRLSGGLEFPVRLSSGEVHDIDELSSGEKEILYGYLQLRNSTPRNSVILLDEPELHLNPSLLHGFADFYHRHLGQAQSNQLWLVTHSDTLLRDAVGNFNYAVFQMVAATASEPGANQAVAVLADDDVERVTVSLVGDLASYRPHGRVVILEGEAPDGFDVTMVQRLFPDFAKRVNLVSGGHKQRVRDLYNALESAAAQAGLKNRFFAIVDKDALPARPIVDSATEFTWDAYHIENYLLDEESIRCAVAALLGRDVLGDETMTRLQACAEGLVDRLVLERIQSEVNGDFRRAIEVKGPPTTRSPSSDLAPSVAASAERVAALAATLTPAELKKREDTARESLVGALADGSWTKEFPGRLILRQFTDDVFSGKINSSLFANAVLTQMVDRRISPAGMKVVIDEIMSR